MQDSLIIFLFSSDKSLFKACIKSSSDKEFELKFNKYYDTTNLDLKNFLVFVNIAYVSYDMLDENKDIDTLQSLQLANSNTINIELNK